MIRKVLEAGPDSFDAVLEKPASLHAEDGGPHGNHERTEDDGRIGTLYAEDGADQDRKCNTVLSAHLIG